MRGRPEPACELAVGILACSFQRPPPGTPGHRLGLPTWVPETESPPYSFLSRAPELPAACRWGSVPLPPHPVAGLAGKVVALLKSPMAASSTGHVSESSAKARRSWPRLLLSLALWSPAPHHAPATDSFLVFPRFFHLHVEGPPLTLSWPTPPVREVSLLMAFLKKLLH